MAEISSPIPERRLGRTGLSVTQIGLGGEGVLRTHGRHGEAQAVIEEALNQGITYFDCARAYDGSEEYYGMTLKARRKAVFLTNKAFERSAKGAARQLELSLATMKTDYLDLWQVHDLRTAEDLDAIAAPGGALEAFEGARKAGKVRFTGVTGHYSAPILGRALDLFPFDTVLMPVSLAHPSFLAFIRETLPRAIEKEMAVIAMKVVGGAFIDRRRTPAEIEVLIRYTLSHPISTAIIGCVSPGEVAMNVGLARGFTPFSEAEMRSLEGEYFGNA
jgi:aryl-alcohol dehydrogenase-like predicted oxidoreductase